MVEMRLRKLSTWAIWLGILACAFTLGAASFGKVLEVGSPGTSELTCDFYFAILYTSVIIGLIEIILVAVVLFLNGDRPRLLVGLALFPLVFWAIILALSSPIA